jgi:hypothetical protein
MWSAARMATLSESTVSVPEEISRMRRSTNSASPMTYSLSPSERML